MSTLRMRLFLGLIVLSTTACLRTPSFQLLDAERKCWLREHDEPRGIDRRDCEKGTENEPSYIDPDGNCWRSNGNCDIRDWDGWRFPTLPGDAFCDEALVGTYYACPEDTD